MNRLSQWIVTGAIVAAFGGLIGKPVLLAMFIFFLIGVSTCAIKDLINHYFGDEWI